MVCGENTHRTEHCPKKALEVYQLPTDIKAKVDALYERDVARMGGSTAGMESEYQSFLKVFPLVSGLGVKLIAC
jgi:hypothetical protein